MNPTDPYIEEKENKPADLNHSRENLMSRTTDHRRTRTVIFNASDFCIELVHHDSDPSTWIIRRWKKFLLCKKRISSDWFTSRSQALTYADELKQNYFRHCSMQNAQEMYHGAQ